MVDLFSDYLMAQSIRVDGILYAPAYALIEESLLFVIPIGILCGLAFAISYEIGRLVMRFIKRMTYTLRRTITRGIFHV